MIQLHRKELGGALRALKPAISRRPGIPALEGVLLEADGAGSATLTATDLELGVVVKLEAAGEAGRLLVPFKILAETVKTGAGEGVRLEAAEGTVHVDGASIRLLPVEDFPTLTGDVNGVKPAFAGSIEAGSFAHGAAVAVASASKDEARPVLTGVLLELGMVDGGAGDPTAARMVSTDSYRLHVAHVDGSGDLRAIVPARALKLVAGALGRKPAGVVSIAGGESEVRFVLPDGLEVRSRIIEGEFPNYRQLIPEAHAGTAVRYELAEFLGALKAARPYCGDVGPVTLDVDGAGVGMSAGTADLGAWAGRLERVTVHGPAVRVAFNPAYLAGALEAAGDGGTLEIRDGLKPGMAFSADGRTLGLVMPVRMPAALRSVPEPEPEPDEPAEAPEVEVDDEPEPEPAEVAEPEPEPDDEPEPEPAMHRAFGVGAPAPIVEERPTAELELERMRAELEAARAMLERVKQAEAAGGPLAEVGGGFTDWAELLDVGSVGPVRVRVVGGSDGRPAVDVRVYGGRRGYTGRTKAGLRVSMADAAELGALVADAAEQAAELERGA